jgi:hypothetical protein
MANFRPKQPITRAGGTNYPDTLENFLKWRPLKRRSRLDNEPINGGNDGKGKELQSMQGKQTDD